MANRLSTTINKIFRIGTAPEGQPRPTYGVGEFGNVFSVPFGNGWERGLNGSGQGYNGTVMSVITVISRVLSASYPNHVKLTDKGGREVVTTSAAHRLLMRPNAAQNPLDFVSHTVLSLCCYGDSYYYVKRNDRFEPIALIPLNANHKRAYFSDDYSAVFYDVSVSGDFQVTTDVSKLVPARDVLHFKLPSRTSVLHGDSPITYAAGATTINSAIQGSSAAFLANMNRPSGILATDQVLTGSQMTELRAKFDEVSKGMNAGSVPILGNGMKWYPMSISAIDSQVLETYNASVLDICRVFGVPIQLLGLENNGAASSVSALIGQFKAGSLLYMAELIEFGLEELFKFDHIKDTVRFDLENVSRADFETEINTLSKGTQNGIFAPNEARNRVGLDSVPFGNEPRVQAQNVRLEDAVPAPSAPSAGQSAAPTKPEPPDDEDDDELTSEEVSKRLAILIKGYSSHA
jgi:HK97 family phage portal protein